MNTSTRVAGKATVGQKVTYFDMANQDGAVYEVISTPEENTDPKWGWTKGYGIRAADGVVGYSDLRQHGWTFATDDAEEEAAEAPVLKMPSMNTTDRAEWNEAARLALSVYHDTGAYDPNLWNVYDGTGRICATRRTEAEAQAAKDELYKERLASYTARQN